MTLQEIKTAIEKLGETTNYDINMIEIDALQAVYDEYSLPALFVEDVFSQGDASDEEIQNTIEEINERFPEMTKLETPDDLFRFLDDEFIEKYEIETLKVIKANWIEYYKEDIEEFLKENFFISGAEIGLDWSVFIDIETGEIWEHTEASSNWGFMDHDPNRKLVTNLGNNDKPFYDYTDLIAEENKKNVSDNLWVDLPEDWDEMDYYEQIEWVEENAAKGIEEYNEVMRDEAIEDILNLIEDQDEAYNDFD